MQKLMGIRLLDYTGSVSQKVLLPSIIATALAVLLVYFSWSALQEHRAEMEKSYTELDAQKAASSALPFALADAQRRVYKYAIWAKAGIDQPVADDMRSLLEADLSAIESIAGSLKLKGLNDAGNQLMLYSNGVRQALKVIPKNPMLGISLLQGFETNFKDAAIAAEEMAIKIEKTFQIKNQQMRQDFNDFVEFFLLIGLVGIASILILSAVSASLIARPIERLARIVEHFSNGQLNVEIPWAQRKDEIGLVARAMASFRSALIRNKELEQERIHYSQQLERQVKQRTHELAEQKDRLADALAKEHELSGLQRQFVAMVCHEFRTPLAIIDGSAQRLLRRHDTITPDRLKGTLQKVRTSVSRLTDLMESVLDAAKLETGTIKFEPQECNPKEMVQEVAASYQELNPDHRIVAEVEPLPDGFSMDAKLMRQVISNLVSNAVKYSPEGTRIWIDGGSTDDGGIVIAVRDEGVGIPEDEVGRLFDRFFRASTSTGIAGTGIGLHMVKALVDVHGGQVEVASQEGEGTTFSVLIPQCVANAVLEPSVDALHEVAVAAN